MLANKEKYRASYQNIGGIGPMAVLNILAPRCMAIVGAFILGPNQEPSNTLHCDVLKAQHEYTLREL